MPDWKRIVQDRIAPLRLEPTAESDLVEEFSQHLEDSYCELRSGGASDEEAHRRDGLVCSHPRRTATVFLPVQREIHSAAPQVVVSKPRTGRQISRVDPLVALREG